MSGLKSQATIELLSLAVIAGAVLVIVTIVSYSYSQQLTEQKMLFGGRELCSFISRESNSAASFGNGFERSFDMPAVVLDFNYNVAFNNQERRVYVWWESGNCSSPLLANVTGVLRPDHNSLKFNDGVVVLN